MNPQQVAQLVKSEINKAISGLANRSVYRAEVVAVAGSRVNVIMEHASGVHPNILCMSGYQPMVGDQVLILNIGLSGSNFICIGRTNSVGTSGNPIGEIQMTLKSAADSGFILMTGGTFNKADYPRLWEVINANPAYGTVDPGTFTLKDMRQRMPMGKTPTGTGSILGELGGELDHRHGAGLEGASGTETYGFGKGDMRAAIGAQAADANRIGYRATGAGMPNGGNRPAGTYSGTWANASAGRTDWNHFTPVYGYTNANNQAYIAVNFQVRAR